MTRAPGKSFILGLLIVALLLLTACRSIRQTVSLQAQPENNSAQQVKLLVQENGLYAVSGQELTDYGLDIREMSSAELRLSLGGETVPAFITDDQLIFYGQAPQGRYTNLRPYILELGQQGTAIQETAVPTLTTPLLTDVPQIIHLEENHIYAPEARQDIDDDVWFWSKLRQDGKFDTEFEILNLAATPAILHVNSWGFTDIPEIEKDHDFDLILNNKPLGTIKWDGQNHNLSDIDIPAGSLVQGQNKITLDNSVAGDSPLDIMHINWLEFEYTAPAIAVNDKLAFSSGAGVLQIRGFSDEPLIFNISDAAHPELLQGWEYDSGQVDLAVDEEMVIVAAGPLGLNKPIIEPMRESNWRNPEEQADLIIITTDELAPAVTPLIETREAQGLSVALVPVEDIYDEFGHGERSPESIREFITYAFANWQTPQPRYLFLVGDATTDYLGHTTDVPRNVVPSLLVPVQFGGETVSDSRLADVDGDKQPDLAVGRWPVRTVREVENLVERTLAYEQGLASDKVLFTADGSELRFSSISENLAKNSLLPAEQVQQLNGPQSDELAEQWKEGAWLATYVGHGSISRWGRDDIVNLDSISSLGSKTPPILLQLTCLTGLFSHPVETSLTEAMLTHPQGPVLTVAATSLTLSNYQEPFATELLQQMQDSTIIRIGDAFQEAKLSLEIDNANGLREISDTFALFGDPSTLMVRP